MSQIPLTSGMGRSAYCQSNICSVMGSLCKGGECPGVSRPEGGRWCLCLHTEEQALSTERGCHPIGEEEYCFPFPGSSIAKETGNPSFGPGTPFLLSAPSSVEDAGAPCRALDTLPRCSSRKLQHYQLLCNNSPKEGTSPEKGS